MLLRIRDDDVLLHSRGHENPFARFKQIHEWTLLSADIVHVPAILVEDIQEFPGCVEYVKEHTANGSMLPEIHGLRHVDYGALSKQQVLSDIAEARDWIEKTFDRAPRIWYTPWGASQPHLHEAAAELGLVLVDVSRIVKMEGETGVCANLRNGMSVERLDGLEIFMHWWNGGSRLLRVCEAVRHGSWAAAEIADPGLFR